MLRTRLFERFVEHGPLTARDVARMLGMTEWHLSRIRNGRVPITQSFVARACMAFALSRDELFYDDASAEREEAAVTTRGG